jgi:hypothetical protein
MHCHGPGYAALFSCPDLLRIDDDLFVLVAVAAHPVGILTEHNQKNHTERHKTGRNVRNDRVGDEERDNLSGWMEMDCEWHALLPHECQTMASLTYVRARRPGWDSMSRRSTHGGDDANQLADRTDDDGHAVQRAFSAAANEPIGTGLWAACDSAEIT